MLLTFVFIYIQEAIFLERSIFDISFLKLSSLKYKDLIISFALTALTVFSLKKISKFFFIISSLGVIYYTVINLNLDFSKLILIILFIYLLVSYYYFYLLDIELNQSIYNPNFKKNDLFKPMLMEIRVTIKSNNKDCSGYLTNWDESGCFIYLEEELDNNSKIIELHLQLRGKVFIQKSVLATQAGDNRAVGVRFINEKMDKNIFNWLEFKKIVSDMGLNVEYIK